MSCISSHAETAHSSETYQNVNDCPLDLLRIRSQFPALDKHGSYVFADNAGGSQVHISVIERITDYLLHSNVQLGGEGKVSDAAARRVLVEAPLHAMGLFNASSPDEISFSSGSTQNMENLARSLEHDFLPGEEIIITREHEGYIGPWKYLAVRKSLTLKYWTPRKKSGSNNPYEVYYETNDLVSMLTSKTRLVAFSAASNILGSILPIKDIVKAIRRASDDLRPRKMEVSVDCVAYAAHRMMDVQDWDVDYCVFSFYKICGPHFSAMYIRKSALVNSVSSIVHDFLKLDGHAAQVMRGGPGYELAFGTTGIIPYLLSLTPQNDLKGSFKAITQQELRLVRPILDFLTTETQRKRGVRVVGDECAGPDRVATISFVVVGDRGIDSMTFAKNFTEKGNIGIKAGNFWAYMLVDNLHPKLDPENGVIRISLVHYNTMEEVDRIISALERALR